MSIRSRWTTILAGALAVRKAKQKRLDAIRADERVAVAERKRAQNDVEYARRVLKRHPAKKPLRERALAEALHLCGTLEVGGNNTGPVVDKIIRANGGVIGEPWCGDFVAYCYRLAGSKMVTRSWAAVRLLLAGSTVKHHENVRPGDIVRYDFNGPGSLSHTGLFVKWTLFGKAFQAIEGNTGTGGARSDGVGDGVHLRTRSVSSVHDFRRVSR